MPTYFWSFWTMKMMWIKSILLFSWSRNAPIHSLGVSRVLLVSSRDSHAATRDVFISLIDLCFFLSRCLLIDLIFNYTSMDHLFMVNGKHTFTRCTFTGKLWEGGGDFRGMKWFSRGYKGGVIRNKSKMVSQSITPFLYRCCRFFTFNRKHLFLQM